MKNVTLPVEQMDHGNLFEIFDKVVASHSLNVAVKSGSRTYTYRDLDEYSSRVGHQLFNQLGPGPRPIAVLMENPADVIAALIGVLRSGNFYSILSTRNPAARLKVILEDLQASVLLVDAALESLARDAAPATCTLVRFDRIPEYPGDRFRCPVSDDSLAGVYYTSGSTGEPKGVMRQRSVVVDRALLEIKSLEVSDRDKVLLTHLLSASASLSTVFTTLLSGAALLVYEPDKLGIAPLKEFAVHEKVTIFRLTVELLRFFLESLPADAYFGDVRIFLSAGDVLYRRDLEKIWKYLPPGALFVHQLAASESSILARTILRSDTRLDGEIVPVGFPFEGQDIFLLDENRKPVPAGNVGEICLRSEWKFPGYWRRPDLTDEKLVPDPLDPARKILFSGDLGRFRADGQLEFIGRKDARVKIRGFSVDMSAVESVLMSFKEVRRAVVLPHEETDGRKRLVAYVSPVPGFELDAKLLRARTAGQLPDYMIPAAFVILQDFPLTATGKIDRRALPSPSWEESQQAEMYVPPSTELEKKLVLIWQKTLGLKRIGVHDNFFDLGGDSLIASALFVEIERQFGLRLPLSFVVENNTVRRMAGELQNPRRARGLVPLHPEGTKPPLFLVPGAYGDALFWRSLLPYLPPDRPVFGVQALQRDGDHLYRYSVEQVAQRFLEDIRVVQPAGPYRLLGYSFGGLIAFEMACQLETVGESVSFVGLVDTSPPGSHREASIPDRIRIHANNLQKLSQKERPQYIKNSLKRLLIKIGQRQVVRKAMPMEKLFPNDHRAATTLIIRSYNPQKVYTGSLTVFRVKERPWYVRWDRMEGWSRLVAGSVIFCDLPGNHGTVVKEPHVKNLGDAINRVLQDEDQ